ncbi:hypothetical protein [Streptomonospora arabica]|uniref:Uncharacterized protein n=1 Tax=Streptomonospora arabica TaxID=412417 RepID=A0ABV9SSN5_9ACTN
MSHYPEDVEADLARYYPRDADQFEAFCRGDMTIRRLHVLVSRLPKGSATYAVRAGGRDRADWDELVELTAKAVEAQREANLLYQQANVDDKKRHTLPKDIERVPRPWPDDEDDT